MKLCRRIIITVAIIFFIATPVLFSQYITQIDTLANVRHRIVFPELTLEEKMLMAEQAEMIFRDLYVHRYHKMEYYGNPDPLAEMEAIVAEAEYLSTPELEEAIYRVFVKQRDLHQNYIFPSPYSAYDSFLPFTLTRTAAFTNYFEVRVLSVNPDFFEVFAPGERIPDIGDEIVRYDNLPIDKAVDRQIATAQGANRFGGFSRAIGQMTYIPHIIHLVPENDYISIELKSVEDGELYTIVLPWLTIWSEAIPESENQDGNELQFQDLLLSQPNVENDIAGSLWPAEADIAGGTETITEKKVILESLSQATDLWQINFNQFVKEVDLEPKTVYPDNPSNEHTIRWGIIKKDGVQFGYLRLTSFSPQKGSDYAIDEIIRLINDEFEETAGLIIDVRNNGGGSISYADKLSQLFMPGDAGVCQARLLNTDLNRQIFNESIIGIFSNPEWTEVVNAAAGTGDIYTRTAPFTYDDDANRMGQVYYKPVVVLTNARSYSATDLFSCSMQDNKAGFIYGEDPRTGAGGANVITYSLFREYVGHPFKPLPGDHEMRFSWRQSVRFGKSEGKLIEDYGCLADRFVSLTLSDILDGGEVQLHRITRELKLLSWFYKPYVKMGQDRDWVTISKDELNLELKTAYTPYIEVIINGEHLQKIPVFAFRREKEVKISLPDYFEPGQVINVTLAGVSFRGKRLWNAKRKVVIVEEKVALTDDREIVLDFSTATDIAPLTVIKRGASGDNWRLENPYFLVGYNPEYKNNTDTSAVVLMDLTERTREITFSFTMDVDTEENFDFIEVFVTDNNMKEMLLRFSGKYPKYTYTMTTDEYLGKDNVSFHFRFISDMFVTAPGVRIYDMSAK